MFIFWSSFCWFSAFILRLFCLYSPHILLIACTSVYQISPISCYYSGSILEATTTFQKLPQTFQKLLQHSRSYHNIPEATATFQKLPQHSPKQTIMKCELIIDSHCLDPSFFDDLICLVFCWFNWPPSIIKMSMTCFYMLLFIDVG